MGMGGWHLKLSESGDQYFGVSQQGTWRAWSTVAAARADNNQNALKITKKWFSPLPEFG
jgi:hypothetical protein